MISTYNPAAQAGQIGQQGNEKWGLIRNLVLSLALKTLHILH